MTNSKDKEQQTAERIRMATDVEGITEALMKCGKVSDMTEAFRAVTGEDFYGRIVGVKKDEVACNMSWQIKRHLEFEAFKGLAFNEKVTELCSKEAYDAGRFLHAFTLEELRKVAEMIGADTSEVRVESKISERLDYITAISHKLIMSPNGIKIHFPEMTENALAKDIQPAEVKFEAGKTYEYHGVQYKIVKRTRCYATMELSTGETVRKEIGMWPNGIEVINISEWPDIKNLKATDEIERKVEMGSQPEALYEDESFSDFLGDNSQPDQDIPEAHTPDEFTAWTDEDFYFYFPNGEMTESDLVELTLEELDALNEYLACKDAEKWNELNRIRACQKYPLVVVKKGYVPPEDMMLYPIGMYDSYEEMKIALDKNFEMVDRCKDETDMRCLFYTCNLHTAYMMVKARGYETDFEEWQSIKDNVVHDFIRQELARREKILKREAISQKKEEITAMLNKYAEISGTIRVIREGVTEIRKGIKMLEKQGQPYDGLLSVIEGAKDEYRSLRVKGFMLRLKLLRVMSAAEIRRVCEAFMARCEEEKRRHMRE